MLITYIIICILGSLHYTYIILYYDIFIFILVLVLGTYAHTLRLRRLDRVVYHHFTRISIVYVPCVVNTHCTVGIPICIYMYSYVYAHRRVTH